MASGTYDIIAVGGGLGGATLAKAMAAHGARVLVLDAHVGAGSLYVERAVR